MEIKRINANQLEFDCRVHGDPKNEMLVFLHGFPETSAMWIPIMEVMSELDFFCIAPNLRGYSEGARPKGRRNYILDNLCSDIIAIANTFGKESYHLIGHDWGSVIGWKLVHDHPKTFKSWTSLSVPHIQGFVEAIQKDRDQQRKSSYIKMFQWPFLPEYRLGRSDFKIFRKLWKNSSEDEVNDYLKVFRSKGTLTAALNYYRANFRGKTDFKIGNVSVPTLFIWGNKDMAIGQESVRRNHEYMPDNYTFIELNTGHWLVQTAFEEVLNALKSHLIKHGNN